MCEQVGWVLSSMGWCIAGLIWSLPFVIAFVWYYDNKTEKLKGNT